MLDVIFFSHQYYATVDPGSDLEEDCYPWLPQENVEDRFEEDLSGLPEMVSSGHSVGGVVYSTIPGTKVLKGRVKQWRGCTVLPGTKVNGRATHCVGEGGYMVHSTIPSTKVKDRPTQFGG